MTRITRIVVPRHGWSMAVLSKSKPREGKRQVVAFRAAATRVVARVREATRMVATEMSP
jgi:hypothetical protein